MEDIADWLFTEVFLKCGKPTKLAFDTQFNVNEVNSVLKILAILGGKLRSIMRWIAFRCFAVDARITD